MLAASARQARRRSRCVVESLRQSARVPSHYARLTHRPCPCLTRPESALGAELNCGGRATPVTLGNSDSDRRHLEVQSACSFPFEPPGLSGPANPPGNLTNQLHSRLYPHESSGRNLLDGHYATRASDP